jgi:hypothetical protein
MIPEGYRRVSHSTLVLKLKSAETGTEKPSIHRNDRLSHSPSRSTSHLPGRSNQSPTPSLCQFDLAILNNYRTDLQSRRKSVLVGKNLFKLL